MRFGHIENLDFVLPSVNNYIGNTHFNTSMIINNYSTGDGQFDMFVHHTRYSQDVKSVMRPGAVYVTVLRNPITLFQSLYSFYHFDKLYKISLTEFMSRSLLKNVSTVKYIRRSGNKLGPNQMSWDLGLDSKHFYNTKMVNKHIHTIEKDFDLILIFEYLDASLILLANLMQWPLEHIAYLPLNTRNNSYMKILTDNDVNKLQQINMADNMLYNRFLQLFKEKIKAFGVEKLKRGISKLMFINQEIIEQCVKSTTNQGYARTMSYKLKEKANINCKYIAMNELKYTSFLRKIQYERQRKYKEIDTLMNNN